MFIFSILGIAIFSLVLFKSADILALHLKALSIRTKLGGFFLTSLIVGLATSLPETFVGIISAINGVPSLALGNVIGANIANMTVVAGGAALLAGSLKIKNKTYASDLLYAFLAAMAPLYLLMDRVLSRVDAVILIVLYLFYNYAILKKQNTNNYDNNSNILTRLLRKIQHPDNRKDYMYVFVSIAAILFSADMIVRIGMSLSSSLNISLLLVGLVFVSLGTTLPEFAVEIQAIRNKDASLYMGNLVGSIVANGTLIIGITSLIQPIHISAFSTYLLATIALLIIFFTFYMFVRTKEMINRIEGLALVIIYAIFVTIEFIK